MNDMSTPPTGGPGATLQPRKVVPPPPGDRPTARRRALTVLGIVVLVVAVAWAIVRLLFASPSRRPTTPMSVATSSRSTARDPGQVTAIRADNTQAVRAGQPLVNLNPATADVNLAAAAADLARAVRSSRADFTRVSGSGATVVQAQAMLARAQDDYRRRQGAAAQGAVTGDELSHARDQVKVAAADQAVARAQAAQAQSTVQGTNVDTNPAVLTTIAAYRHAAIARGHMHVVAPIDGVVAQRTVQLGQQVAAGMPMMAVVPLDRVWVDANFRETQLKDVHIGQPATITADVYGGGTVNHGHVIGLGAGSDNAFALLPPQNASGNWIKIVQRLPVRIGLDARELRNHPLRVGLSAQVTVDTANTGGTLVGRPAAQAYGAQATDANDPAVEARIRQIIAANR